MKVVEVVWVDAIMEDGYMDSEGVENLSLMTRHNVGYLVHRDRDVIKLCFGTLSDGRFDDISDWYYKCIDINKDGKPEAEYYHLFPGVHDYSNRTHVNLDGQLDMSFLNWKDFFYGRNEQYYLPGKKYIINVRGSGFFLNGYSNEVVKAWENPIAWYDFDFDGFVDFVYSFFIN